MTDIYSTRRANLKTLIEERSAASVSKDAGYASTSYLSQMMSPTSGKLITEKTARRIETRLGLPDGWLSKEASLFGKTVVPPAPTPEKSTPPVSFLDEEHTLRCAHIVSGACAAQGANLPREKFKTLVQMVMSEKDRSDESLQKLADMLVSLAK